MATETFLTALIANEIERHRVLHGMHLIGNCDDEGYTTQ